MKNKYEVRGTITAIFLNSPKYGTKETLISTSKLGLVMEFTGTWHVRWSEGVKSFYVQGSETTRKSGKQKTISLHRWITNAPDGMFVDHINHETLNNTDQNLRNVTSGENQQNRRGCDTGNKSGVLGVTWHGKVNKWRARIMVNSKELNLGLFADLAEAEQTVKEARAKYMPFSKEAS